MKKYDLINMLIATLIVCHLPLLAVAQIQRNTSIDFYGKVIDQHDQPIAGAEVKIQVVADPTGSNLTEERRYTLKTDQSGKFVLTGATGFSMGITSITKPGYELSNKTKRGYSYLMASRVHHPDSNAPVAFKMWKQTEKEPLVHSSWHGKVPCDGTTNNFDLLTGKSLSDGNLKIICTRTPLNYEPTNRPPYEYKFEIILNGGEVQTAEDEFTYLAPEANYAPTLTIERKSGDPKWSAGVRQDFYIKTAEGHYGCLSVQWDAGHRPSPTYLEWSCSINPSGSRNLER